MKEWIWSETHACSLGVTFSGFSGLRRQERGRRRVRDTGDEGTLLLLLKVAWALSSPLAYGDLNKIIIIIIVIIIIMIIIIIVIKIITGNE